MRIITIKRQD